MPTTRRGCLVLACSLAAMAPAGRPPAVPQDAPALPPTLEGAVVPLDRAHTGRFGRQEYTLTRRAGQIAVLFAPLPLANAPETLGAAAAHVITVAFADAIDPTAPLRREAESVVTLVFSLPLRRYAVTPVRNERGFVHSLLIQVDAPPAR